jgi:hypothetical protein
MREADHSPPSSAEVKNDGAIPPLPHMSPWREVRYELDSYILFKRNSVFKGLKAFKQSALNTL